MSRIAVYCDRCHKHMGNYRSEQCPSCCLCNDCASAVGGHDGWRRQKQEQAAYFEWVNAGRPSNVPADVFWKAARGW